MMTMIITVIILLTYYVITISNWDIYVNKTFGIQTCNNNNIDLTLCLEIMLTKKLVNEHMSTNLWVYSVNKEMKSAKCYNISTTFKK